jgi:hypothetical protein
MVMKYYIVGTFFLGPMNNRRENYDESYNNKYLHTKVPEELGNNAHRERIYFVLNSLTKNTHLRRLSL